LQKRGAISKAGDTGQRLGFSGVGEFGGETLYYLFHNIILAVIFHLVVKRYVYVVVCGTCGKHT
jgi:hypothetical protein